jgi:hypothetical protein
MVNKTFIKASRAFAIITLSLICILLNTCLLLSRGDINRIIYRTGTNQIVSAILQVAYMSLYIICNQILFILIICGTHYYHEKATTNERHPGIMKFHQLRFKTKLRCLLQSIISLQFFIILFLFIYYQSDLFSRLRLFINTKTFRGYLYFVLCMLTLSLSLSIFLSMIISLVYKNIQTVRYHRELKKNEF